MPSFSPATRNLIRICLATAGWAFSFGLGSQLTTHWLKDVAASDTVIGLNHACYYLGVALASLLVPTLTRRLGRACAPLGMVLSGLSLAVFPWGGGTLGWCGLRLLNGGAGALCLIPLETLVSQDSPAGQRTRHFGFYAVALTLAGAAGIWAGLHLFEPGNVLPFFLGAVSPVGSSLLLLSLRRSPSVATTADAPPLAWAARHLSYGTAWSQGFLEGGMLAFLSLYLLSRGLSADTAGGLMGATMIGVILFQVPVAWLADRLGRLPVLLACYAVVLAGLLLVPWCQDTGLLTALLFLFGACCGAMYPLGLALLGDHGSEHALSRSYACYLAMECVGSQMGAAAMGRARDVWGEWAMFPVGAAAVGGVLLSWGAIRLWGACRRPAEAAESLSQRRAA
jgi:MFS family permease